MKSKLPSESSHCPAQLTCIRPLLSIGISITDLPNSSVEGRGIDKYSPGFISNRILIPMINEAIEALDQKVATVKNIDGIMKLGMGHPMGPLQLADLIGLDVCKSILDVMFEGFKDSKYKANRLLVKLVEDGKLGMKSGEGFYDYSNSRKAEFVSKRFLNDCWKYFKTKRGNS